MSQVVEIDIGFCSVFFSFLRIYGYIYGSRNPSVSLVLSENRSPINPQKCSMLGSHDNGAVEFQLEALIDRSQFPERMSVCLQTEDDVHTIPCSTLTEQERQKYSNSLQGSFDKAIERWLSERPGEKPKLLDIGGRARSGKLRSEEYSCCDVTVLDIVPDNGVDVISDVHDMSSRLPHEYFDFAMCVSVFEHLLMPWKAVLEMSKVLKLGGLAIIHTHQTIGMHDRPWDFYRFSDDSWDGLFNSYTGFAIEERLMSDFVFVVPSHFYSVGPFFERSGGFEGSSVIVRKVGPTTLEWPGPTARMLKGQYPA